MKMLVLSAAAAATLFASSASAAIIQSKEGTVSQINVGRGTLVLTNGELYQMLNPASLYGYLPGDHVIVGYDMDSGRFVGRSLSRIPTATNSHTGEAGIVGTYGGMGGGGGGDGPSTEPPR